MKITKREFGIAATGALAGFILCYFLSGQQTTPRRASGMSLVVALPKTATAPRQAWMATSSELSRTNFGTVRPIAGEYQIKARPELLGQPARQKVDLMSSRHKAEVDLSDLY